MLKKVCGRCGIEKPLEDFHKSHVTLDGRITTCKSCRKEYESSRYTDKAEAIRYRKIEKQYGLTQDDFVSLYFKQNQCCAICGCEFDDVTKTRVDHNHKTGEVRGLLCNNCNVGLGFFGDSIQNLESAIDYLQGSKLRLLSPMH